VKKEFLFDLIQRVRDMTGIAEPVIVGSQSLFASTEDVPKIVRDSIECDFLLAQASIEAMQVVNQNLGILSPFAKAAGYYADGLGLATVVLVPGWEERLQPLTDETGQVVARCLEAHDVAVSKLMAGRDKDFTFIIELLAGRLITLPTLVERAALIQETASAGALSPRLQKLLGHLSHQRVVNDLTPLHDLIKQLA
jgi:hypothetical protein